MRAQFHSLDGGPTIEIVKDMTLVGRKEDCDVCLDHKSISKMHCVIVKTDGLLLLRDLGSTNGTRVNGQRIRRAALLPNDQVAFASFKYRVSISPTGELVAPSKEHTQHLEPGEVASLMAKPPSDKNGDSSVEIPILPAQANPLPDVYPDDRRARKG